MNTTKTKTETAPKQDKRSEEQARAQLESIRGMVARVNHCRECDGGEDCTATPAEIFGGLNIWPKEGQKPTDAERRQYHDEDDARQVIQEDALSVEVRGDWHTPGGEDAAPTEYKILLCTGGPACQIVGDLDEHNEPDTATIQHQDWFTPWQDLHPLTDEDTAALLDYARNFYFGE
jgi:hypothetical protein